MKIVLTLELDPAEILSDCFEPEDGINEAVLSEVLELMDGEGDLRDVALEAISEFVTDNAHEYIARYFDEDTDDEEVKDEGI